MEDIVECTPRLPQSAVFERLNGEFLLLSLFFWLFWKIMCPGLPRLLTHFFERKNLTPTIFGAHCLTYLTIVLFSLAPQSCLNEGTHLSIFVPKTHKSRIA